MSVRSNLFEVVKESAILFRHTLVVHRPLLDTTLRSSVAFLQGLKLSTHVKLNALSSDTTPRHTNSQAHSQSNLTPPLLHPATAAARIHPLGILRSGW